MIADMSWERVDLSMAERELPIAVGGSTAPHRLLEAHRHGAFPYPRCRGHAAGNPRDPYTRYLADGRITAFPCGDGGDAPAVTWWSPARRPVIAVGAQPPDGCLRDSVGDGPRWIVTCGHDFAGVVDACRDRGGSGWITGPLRSSLITLHEAGWAHSIEVWHGERLIAGLFGTGIGNVFSVDSAFGLGPHAIRVAFADLARRLRGRAELIDLQVPRDFAAGLDVRSVSREEYLDALLTIDMPLVMRAGVLAVQPLPHGAAAP
ncbi:leucyl/phenylalanyl-tRNA--protein transferase [Streptomyces sp. SL13]|uniref:Leucyl/phenylalanyl-tRNA--protein transferase n=1 Tax=Streptantibioticus silvisoli TaxID=2705255 RepID=A0AA90H9T7_9ACTN|nr:leucyl/phenylalanyl-tRNA--protein transferase [Streptantibioticus silvisoli]MDI5962227.1 leucyl/phenylalanyl-tRNA--protein transferase [Streptantibioticus silvisoli]MDI5970657.1 leucyl/phenylalanyl-tRNA--protein transferase [Streptantibioticus silvisoli]